MAMQENHDQMFDEVVKFLTQQSFLVTPGKNRRIKVVVHTYVNPADMRQKIAEVMASVGYQGYWLRESYAYMSSKKPWRTDEEGHVELQLWPEFKKDLVQARVSNLNRAVLSTGIKVIR